jgi:hemolysin III
VEPNVEKGLRAFLREPFSGLSHLASAVAAAIGVLVLLGASRAAPGRIASFVIYGLSLVLLFSASAAYHLIRARPSTEKLLRRLDHSAIYLLIAGTYTPICISVLPGAPGTAILFIIWALAGAGITAKAFLFDRIPLWVSTALYIAMGWLGVVAVVPLVKALPPEGIVFLAAGGGFYTLGALIYGLKKPDPFPGVFGSHEIWHLFVSAGAAAHFLLMLRCVAPL